MEADEAGTLAALKARRKNVLEPLVAKHQGRVFKVTGDGVLVEFASAVNAVQCAVDLQHGMTAANGGQPEDGHIVLRIGINLGDVMVEGSDLYGDGVNIAARLEAIAEPGGILISGTAHDYVRNKVKVGFDDLGSQTLKNITEPVRAYRVTGAPTIAVAAPKLVTEKPSIAVLPFTNMSADAEQEFLSDGITEDLITQLSRFRELFVISRSSSFVFKGKMASIPEVASKLGVQYVVEGSIRKVGDRVRVTAQLVDGRRDVHIWADRYDRELIGIFDLQDEVVRTIAATLVGRLGHATHERTKRQSAGDLRAYELYLRGLEHFFAWTPRDNEKAKDLFQSAIDIEPDYAAAHAALSEAMLRGWLNGWTATAQLDFAAFLEFAERSVQLDDEDSRTHVALGLACMYHELHDMARIHLEKAIRLNPSDVHALAYLSRLELFAGNPELAIERVQEASRLNPFGKYGWYLGQAYYTARRYAEAVVALKSLSDPTALVLAWLAASQAMAGARRDAKSSHEAFVTAAKSDAGLQAISDTQEWRQFFARRWPFQKEPDLEHLFTGLGKAGLPV
ncbi:MAG: hypothetical protein L0210_12300 [Rhodospirillales bacterium]|nr:hypothetical protein [Rhodospirillales bacterium]